MKHSQKIIPTIESKMNAVAIMYVSEPVTLVISLTIVLWGVNTQLFTDQSIGKLN